MIWTMHIPGWRPASVNQLLQRHWALAAKLKKNDQEVVSRAVMAYGVPRASGKRKVSILILIPKGLRTKDPDAYYKSLLDALVRSGALRDDTRNYVEISQPRFGKGEILETFITLEDVD